MGTSREVAIAERGGEKNVKEVFKRLLLDGIQSVTLHASLLQKLDLFGLIVRCVSSKLSVGTPELIDRRCYQAAANDKHAYGDCEQVPLVSLRDGKVPELHSVF